MLKMSLNLLFHEETLRRGYVEDELELAVSGVDLEFGGVECYR